MDALHLLHQAQAVLKIVRHASLGGHIWEHLDARPANVAQQQLAIGLALNQLSQEGCRVGLRQSTAHSKS